jgi:predicted DNA-binding transcriptional regulator AlpA
VTESESIAAALDRIARAAAIPISAKWLDTAGVGAILGYKAAQVRDRISVQPGFPVPLRINGGHPRWKASEILEWAEAERERTRI